MVREGYKETNYGILPEDWEIVTIDEISLDMADGPFGSNLKKVHYTNKREARIIQLGNIGEDGWKDENTKYTTFEHAKEISRCVVTPGNAVVAKMMPAGRAIVCPNAEKMYVLSSDAVKIAFDENTVLTQYFVYATKTKLFQQQISDEIQGSTRARTSISKLRKNYIALPPIHEQSIIVEALSDIDALITSFEKLMEKKKAIKQGATQELLTGKKRLPGFEGEWEKVRIGDTCNVLRGGSPRPIQNYLTDDPRGINWIKIGDVKEGEKYIESTAERIIEAGVSMSREVFAGDFILSNSMSFGRPYILKIDGCIHDGWLVIQNYQSDFNQQYLYYVLGSSIIKEQYISMAAGSSVQNLNKDKVSNVIISRPEKDEQIAIASILSDIDTEISKIEAELEKYRQIKQGMMNELLTGKIRLL